MKKFLLPLLALSALVSCEQNEIDPVDNDGFDTNYIAVNVFSSTGSSTRAVPDDNQFEDGIAAENNVSGIRFYFFDGAGNAANVVAPGGALGSTASGFTNYYDWTPGAGEVVDDGATNTNITRIANAKLVINTKLGDKLPEQMVAIVNCPEGLETNLSLTELRAKVGDYLLTEADKFLMTDAVYKDGGVVDAVSVAGKIKKSEAEALADPAIIHVERTVAKVTFAASIGGTDKSKSVTVDGKTFTIYKTERNIGKGENTDPSDDVYVHFLNWDLTATANESFLLKHINATWADDIFGNGADWNDPGRFRSYWAYNPTGVTYSFKSFNAHNTEKTLAYCQENAAKDAGNNAVETVYQTKLIVPAQLTDANGNPLTLVEWAGMRMTEADFETAFASCLAQLKITKAGQAERVMTKDDVTFRTMAGSHEVADVMAVAEGSRNNVLPIVADATATYTLNGAAKTAEEVNTYFAQFGQVKYWNDGYTYYYQPIQHLGETVGKFGVVRNHVYKMTVTNVTGLGTPVFDPEEPIVPEKPVDDDSYLAAQIKVLSWRIVSNSFSFDW